MAPVKKGRVVPGTSRDEPNAVGEVTTGAPPVGVPEGTQDPKRVDLEDQHQDSKEDPEGTTLQRF
jgi:hypothetical protein